MKKLKLFAFVIAGFAFAMVSCSKGTTGPKGDTGAAGPAGPDSVVYSQWIPVSTSFAGLDASNDSVFEQIVSAPTITQAILDKGVVLTYVQLSDGSVSEVSDFTTFLDVYYGVGSVTMDSYGIDLSQAGWSVRYVVVAGSVAAGNSILKGYTKAQLKAANYSVIAKALGIKDTKAPN